MMNILSNSVKIRFTYLICYVIIDLKIAKGMVIVNYPDFLLPQAMSLPIWKILCRHLFSEKNSR